jgi:exonuclease SbcC
MRLHRLEIAAFGPYRDREVVDFDALGADGLFLLHGDTGAGKTTLLDAIAFALFGVVPGARGEVKRLRCDFADADTVTEVVLELTVQGHRLRLGRSPEYQRPKRRGEGTTTQPAKASLAWTGPAPHGQAPEGLIRIDEVGRTVQRLLGMTADQFFQVVLLPQGEFARFLRADTTEREQLLERLFGTRRFAEVERWFRELRTERGRALEQGRQALRDWLARLAQVAQEDPPEEPGGPWVDGLLERAANAVAEAEAAERAARAAREAANAALAERRSAAERVRRVRSAHERLAALAREADRRAQWAEELAAARRAAGVTGAADQADSAAERLEGARQAEAARARALADTGGEGLDDEVAALRVRAGTLREQAGALAGLVGEAAQQEHDQREILRLREVATEAAGEVAVLADKLAALPGRAQELRDELAAATEAEGRLADRRAREAELTESLADAKRLPVAERAMARTEKALQTATDEHHRAREHWLELRELRVDGMAAELARGLTPGDPCPVCGGQEHPVPAQPADGWVDEAKERAAQKAVGEAEQARVTAEAARRDAELRVAGLRERVRERTEDSLAVELAQLREDVAALAELAGRRARLAAEVESVDAETAQLADQRAAAERAAATAAAQRRGLEERVAERAARLEAARGDHADVGARRAHLVAVVDALEGLAESRTVLAAARDRLDEQRHAVDQALRKAGFVTVDGARAAARPDRVIDDLDRRLSAAEVAEATERAVLNEPELAGVLPDDEVDVESARLEAEEAQRQAESAFAVLRAATARAAELDRLSGRLRAAVAELAPVEQEYAELDALTDVVNGRGQNARKMSLRSYVLAARLEEVALAATARLRTMTQGRYSFVHSDEKGARGTRGGLGLDVLDDYSGTVRPTKTLSGGESFLASLALALGLADVVAAETGGALLDTLFVDEGFGTLDADSLDIVMNILDELRAGGRVVGLVSHVEELRQRIPTRLRVRKSRTGSTLELQV